MPLPSRFFFQTHPQTVDTSRGTDQSGVKLYNQRLVLSLIRSHESLSKTEIARRTGLFNPDQFGDHEAPGEEPALPGRVLPESPLSRGCINRSGPDNTKERKTSYAYWNRLGRHKN